MLHEQYVYRKILRLLLWNVNKNLLKNILRQFHFSDRALDASRVLARMASV